MARQKNNIIMRSTHGMVCETYMAFLTMNRSIFVCVDIV